MHIKAEPRPIRSDTRVRLVRAIARGRQWLSEIETDTATIDAIAEREACSKRRVQMTISLAPSLASTVGYRTGFASPACSMRRSRGHDSIRCWGCRNVDSAHPA
jgi:hypothetical protein